MNSHTGSFTWNYLGEQKDRCLGHPPRESGLIGLAGVAAWRSGLLEASPSDSNMHPSLRTTDWTRLLHVPDIFSKQSRYLGHLI